MLPENLAISVTDVLNYHQKHEKVFVPARTYSAISLRLKTPGKYICKGKTITFKPTSICIIPAGVAYERNNFEEDILVIHFQMLNYTMEEIHFKIFPHKKRYWNVPRRTFDVCRRSSTRWFYR